MLQHIHAAVGDESVNRERAQEHVLTEVAVCCSVPEVAVCCSVPLLLVCCNAPLLLGPKMHVVMEMRV